MLLRLVLLLLLLVYSEVSHPAAPTASEVSATTFDRSRMLEYVARHVMLATYTEFATATRTMMETCASVDEGEPLYYHAPTPDDLAEIFHRIGEDLSDIHLSM